MPWLINFLKFLVFPPIFIYFYSIYIYATNIPFSDDYVIHLEQMIPIIQSDTLAGKLKLLFSSSLEVLLFFNKITILLVYSFLGEINLKVFIFIGNSALLGLLFVFYKMLPENREKIFLVFPVVLLLFQLKPNWVHMVWGVNLAYHFGLFFSGLTFYFLVKRQTKYFYSASFFAVCSLFSVGSGVATLATGWLILIIQKRFKLASIWFAGIILVLSPFFYLSKLTSSTTSSFLTVSSLNNLGKLGNFFISFLGVSFTEKPMVAFIFGTPIVFYFLFLLYKKYYVTNLTVFSFMVYIILVAVMVAMGRSGLAENSFLSDRYKIFSLTMVILIYISLVDLFYSYTNKKWIFLVGMIMITGSMYLVSYLEGKNKLAFSKYILVWRTNQWLNQNFNLMADPFGHRSNAIMTKALTSGYYKLPYNLINIPDNRFSPLAKSADLCNLEKKMAFHGDFNVIAFGPVRSPFLVRIEGVIYNQKLTLPEKVEPVYVILDSLEGKYIFTAHTQEHIEKSIHFRQGIPNKGLLALIPFRKIKDNIYRLGLCYRERVVFSNHFIVKHNHQFKHIIK